MSNVPASLADIEALFAETILKVADMDGMLKTVLATQATMAKAHSDIGVAFTLMSKTFETTEKRQAALETTNTGLYREKGIPPNIFFLVTGTMALVMVLVAIWATDTNIKATYNSFEAGRKADVAKIESSIKEAKTEVIKEVTDGNENK